MNWDQMEGKWKQASGKVKEKWGKLTDNDLQMIRGKRDQLIGKVQERYGIAKEEAEKNPFFKKVYDSQRAYASQVVPARRFAIPWRRARGKGTRGPEG